MYYHRTIVKDYLDEIVERGNRALRQRMQAAFEEFLSDWTTYYDEDGEQESGHWSKELDGVTVWITRLRNDRYGWFVQRPTDGVYSHGTFSSWELCAAALAEWLGIFDEPEELAYSDAD